jgi:hypothetical protein
LRLRFRSEPWLKFRIEHFALRAALAYLRSNALCPPGRN